MATVHPWSIIWTAAAVALVCAVFVGAGSGRPLWAGQEEQFTPEFKALRSSFDPKHTSKITAPDSVKRGQWFEVTVSVGAGGEHPSLSELDAGDLRMSIDFRRVYATLLERWLGVPSVDILGGSFAPLEIVSP